MREIINFNDKKQPMDNESTKGNQEIFEKNKEMISELSIKHNITIDINNGEVEARQLNNGIFLSENQKEYIQSTFLNVGYTSFNIPYNKVSLLLKKRLKTQDVIVNPVNVILFSSKGLVAGEKMTSIYPSEGIWTIADWLSRHNAVVAPICVDPNMINDEQIENVIDRYSNNNGVSIYAFSILPVNLENDLQFISRVKASNDNSVVIAGGIGSESLSILPTKKMNRGVETSTDIDLVISGTGVTEISDIMSLIYTGDIIDRASLRERFNEISKKIHNSFDESNFSVFLDDLRYSRELVATHFIPFERPDIVHNITYTKFNSINKRKDAPNVVSILTDNRCDQKCFFCSSPKQKVFENVTAAAHAVKEKTSDADIIVFNNNDLSNNPVDTIKLCEQMKKDNIDQPKHGKLRANRFLPELYDAMADVNFVRVGVGVESFSQEMRTFIGKGNFSNEMIDKNLNYMLKKNIRPEINLILFLPKETDQTLRVTITKALHWIEKGAWILPVMGLYAVPNSPAVMKMLSRKGSEKKIKFKEIRIDGQEDILLFPDKWRTSLDMDKLYQQILSKRDELIEYFSLKYKKPLAVPIRAFIVIAALAQYYKVKKYISDKELYDSIDLYIQKNIDIEYIHI
jgi:radical SAM superfamily enzyme YgiQ (UPF0313 family)